MNPRVAANPWSMTMLRRYIPDVHVAKPYSSIEGSSGPAFWNTIFSNGEMDAAALRLSKVEKPTLSRSRPAICLSTRVMISSLEWPYMAS